MSSPQGSPADRPQPTFFRVQNPSTDRIDTPQPQDRPEFPSLQDELGAELDTASEASEEENEEEEEEEEEEENKQYEPEHDSRPFQVPAKPAALRRSPQQGLKLQTIDLPSDRELLYTPRFCSMRDFAPPPARMGLGYTHEQRENAQLRKTQVDLLESQILRPEEAEKLRRELDRNALQLSADDGRVETLHFALCHEYVPQPERNMQGTYFADGKPETLPNRWDWCECGHKRTAEEEMCGGENEAGTEVNDRVSGYLSSLTTSDRSGSSGRVDKGKGVDRGSTNFSFQAGSDKLDLATDGQEPNQASTSFSFEAGSDRLDIAASGQGKGVARSGTTSPSNSVPASLLVEPVEEGGDECPFETTFRSACSSPFPASDPLFIFTGKEIDLEVQNVSRVRVNTVDQASPVESLVASPSSSEDAETDEGNPFRSPAIQEGVQRAVEVADPSISHHRLEAVVEDPFTDDHESNDSPAPEVTPAPACFSVPAPASMPVPPSAPPSPIRLETLTPAGRRDSLASRESDLHLPELAPPQTPTRPSRGSPSLSAIEQWRVEEEQRQTRLRIARNAAGLDDNGLPRTPVYRRWEFCAFVLSFLATIILVAAGVPLYLKKQKAGTN